MSEHEDLFALMWQAESRESRILGDRPDDGKDYALAELFLGGHGYWYCGGSKCRGWHEDKGEDYYSDVNHGWLGGVDHAESLMAAGEKKPEEIVPLSHLGRVAPAEKWGVR